MINGAENEGTEAKGGGCPFLKKRKKAVADLAEAALAVPMVGSELRVHAMRFEV